MGEQGELLPVSAIESFESWCEDMFDGLRRALRAPIEPVTIQRRMAQQMRAHVQVHPGRLVAPNRYRVRLSVSDFTLFAARIGSLERDLASGLADEAARSALAFLCPPLVELVADPDVPRGRLRVECSLADAGREPAFWWRSNPPDASRRRATGLARRAHRAIRLVRAAQSGSDRRPRIRAALPTATQIRASRPVTRPAGRMRRLMATFARILVAVAVIHLMVLGPARAATEAAADAAATALTWTVRFVDRVAPAVLGGLFRSEISDKVFGDPSTSPGRAATAPNSTTPPYDSSPTPTAPPTAVPFRAAGASAAPARFVAPSASPPAAPTPNREAMRKIAPGPEAWQAPNGGLWTWEIGQAPATTGALTFALRFANAYVSGGPPLGAAIDISDTRTGQRRTYPWVCLDARSLCVFWIDGRDADLTVTLRGLVDRNNWIGLTTADLGAARADRDRYTWDRQLNCPPAGCYQQVVHNVAGLGMPEVQTFLRPIVADLLFSSEDPSKTAGLRRDGLPGYGVNLGKPFPDWATDPAAPGRVRARSEFWALSPGKECRLVVYTGRSPIVAPRANAGPAYGSLWEFVPSEFAVYVAKWRSSPDIQAAGACTVNDPEHLITQLVASR